MKPAAILFILCPVGAQAQIMECLAPKDALEIMPAVASALELSRDVFPDFVTTLDTAVDQVCLARPPFGARGYFEPDGRRLVIADDLENGLQQAVFFHELRHARQFELSACPQPDLSMQDYAEAIFAMEADASVSAVVIADALRALGDPRMWQALEAWPMQADIVAAYADELEAGADITDAAAVAFETWYANSTRRDAYYIGACMDYLDREDREHLIPQYQRLEQDFTDRLCTLPSGETYPCARPE